MSVGHCRESCGNGWTDLGAVWEARLLFIHWHQNVFYPVSQKGPFYCFNNSVKNQPILIIFVTLNPEIIWHEHLTDLSNSPVRCSHFALGYLKKSFFSIKVFGYLYKAIHKFQILDWSCKEIFLSFSKCYIWQSWANRLWKYYFTVNKHQVYIPILLYGLEACPLLKSDLLSIDFIVNSLFMKLSKTSNRGFC